jgi:rubrerythrin
MEKTDGTYIPTTKLVCLRCGQNWDRLGSPADCPHCGKVSAAISQTA